MTWDGSAVEPIPEDLIQAGRRHVRVDCTRDAIADPWSWPEFEALPPEVLDRHLRRVGVFSPISVDESKGWIGRRPSVILHPLDRLLYQVLVDQRVPHLHQSLQHQVHGYRRAPNATASQVRYAHRDRAGQVFRRKRDRWDGGHYGRTDIASFFASVSMKHIDELLAGVEPYVGTARLRDLLRGWSGARPGRGALPQRCLPSFVLANALLTNADEVLVDRPGLTWLRWVDDYALRGTDKRVVVSAIEELEVRLGQMGFRLSPGKTETGSPARDVFRSHELAMVSAELEQVEEEPVDPTEDAELFLTLVGRILAEPHNASIREVSFVVTRLKLHPRHFDRARWVNVASRLPHAARHIARLVRADSRFCAQLEPRLPELITTNAWQRRPWAIAHLLEAWTDQTPDGLVSTLKPMLAEPRASLLMPRLAWMLHGHLPLARLQREAADARDWYTRRAWVLAAGRAGAPGTWLRPYMEREELETLGPIYDLFGDAIFHRAVPANGETPK